MLEKNIHIIRTEVGKIRWCKGIIKNDSKIKINLFEATINSVKEIMKYQHFKNSNITKILHSKIVADLPQWLQRVCSRHVNTFVFLSVATQFLSVATQFLSVATQCLSVATQERWRVTNVKITVRNYSTNLSSLKLHWKNIDVILTHARV